MREKLEKLMSAPFFLGKIIKEKTSTKSFGDYKGAFCSYSLGDWTRYAPLEEHFYYMLDAVENRNKYSDYIKRKSQEICLRHFGELPPYAPSVLNKTEQYHLKKMYEGIAPYDYFCEIFPPKKYKFLKKKNHVSIQKKDMSDGSFYKILEVHFLAEMFILARNDIFVLKRSNIFPRYVFVKIGDLQSSMIVDSEDKEKSIECICFIWIECIIENEKLEYSLFSSVMTENGWINSDIANPIFEKTIESAFLDACEEFSRASLGGDTCSGWMTIID